MSKAVLFACPSRGVRAVRERQRRRPPCEIEFYETTWIILTWPPRGPGGRCPRVSKLCPRHVRALLGSTAVLRTGRGVVFAWSELVRSHTRHSVPPPSRRVRSLRLVPYTPAPLLQASLALAHFAPGRSPCIASRRCVTTPGCTFTNTHAIISRAAPRPARHRSATISSAPKPCPSKSVISPTWPSPSSIASLLPLAHTAASAPLALRPHPASKPSSEDGHRQVSLALLVSRHLRHPQD